MPKTILQFEQQVKKVIKALPPRIQKIIEERYGLFGKSAMTLEAIGRKRGITRERVRQIENDSLRKITESDEFSLLDEAFMFLEGLFKDRGFGIPEHHILKEAVFGAPKASNLTLFLLELFDGAERRKDNKFFYSRWQHKKYFDERIEKALQEFTHVLKLREEAYNEDEFLALLRKRLDEAGIHVHTGNALLSFIAITKNIWRNSWGEYGHISCSFVKPRGMKDEAYIALKKADEPLHFTEIARRIKETVNRPVHVQTVHNELIKDDRFVLVGRGLYALHSWGYEPGFVKDVIIKILKNGPATEEKIIQEVCQQRLVKKSTVVTNLQNRKHFTLSDNGTYTLLS